MNETLFRDVNEMILKEQEKQHEERTSFVCECSRVSCQLKLNVSLEEYKAVRAHPGRFLCYPGHEVETIEVVVGGEPPRYVAVEKIGPGRDVAQKS